MLADPSHGFQGVPLPELANLLLLGPEAPPGPGLPLPVQPALLDVAPVLEEELLQAPPSPGRATRSPPAFLQPTGSRVPKENPKA